MKIIIPGDPVSQARMRHSTFRGFSVCYDPRAKEKKNIRWQLRDYLKEHQFQHPRITFMFHMPIPKSTPKRDLALYTSGLLKHEKKPDTDNLIKLYLDCLDGITFSGDQMVSLGPAVKLYHPEPKTIIWLTETSRILQPWELDVPFLDAVEPDIPCFCSQAFPLDSESLWLLTRGLSAHSCTPAGTSQPLAPPA